MTSSSVRASVSMSLGVAAAVSLYGISFGALAVASGLDFWQTQVLSLFMFSGGSQFAVIGLAATGAPGLSIITAAGLLGVRNGLYAVRMSAVVGPGFWKRLLAGHWTIDESTAVAIAHAEPRAQRIGFWLTGGAIFVGWNAMTAAGAILGDAYVGVGCRGRGRIPRIVVAADSIPSTRRGRRGSGSHHGADRADCSSRITGPHRCCRGNCHGTPGRTEAPVTLWTTILIASAVVLGTKLLGYLVPASVAAHPRIQRISDVLTVALLASLVVTQTVATGSAIVVDARIAALVVGAVLLRIRAPFIIVVLTAAAVAAVLRVLGWAA